MLYPVPLSFLCRGTTHLKEVTMARILLVEDSLYARNIIKGILGPEHEYLEAEDGFMGIELFSRHKPDLVILDLTMPGVHGLKVLEEMRRMGIPSRIVVGTADVQEATRQEALTLGAFAVVHKPFVPEVLRQVVAQALENLSQGGEPC